MSVIRSESHLRIAMVAACPFPLQRGTPARIHGMAQALTEAGHEVHVVCYPLGDQATPLSFAVHRTAGMVGYRRTAPGPDPIKLGYLDPLLALLTARVVAKFSVNVIHAHHFEGLLTALLARRRTGQPIVYDAHTTLTGELPYHRTGLPPSWSRRIGKWLDIRIPPLANHVSTTTHVIADGLITNGMAPGRVTVVDNCLEDSVLAASSMAGQAGRDPGHEHVVYAGSITGYQRLDLLLQAFAQVRTTHPGVRLLMVTDDSFEPLESLAQELGLREAIELMPALPPDQLVQFLATEADILVNPRIECPGYPFKLLNYMAAGRCIVSFRGSSGGLRHGEDAWLIDTPTAEGFAQGMAHVLGNSALRIALGKAARQQVVTNSRWHGMVPRLEQIYETVMGRHSGGLK